MERYVARGEVPRRVAKARARWSPRSRPSTSSSKALELKPEQSDRFAEDIRGIQRELYEVLSVPRTDGVVPLDDIVEAEQYPDGTPRSAPRSS